MSDERLREILGEYEGALQEAINEGGDEADARLEKARAALMNELRQAKDAPASPQGAREPFVSAELRQRRLAHARATAETRPYITDRPTPLTDNLPMLRTDDLDAALKWRESHRTLERDRAELIEGLERIAWHELTWKEARDLARALLSKAAGGEG